MCCCKRSPHLRPESTPAHAMRFGTAVEQDGAIQFTFFAPGVQNVQLELQGLREPLPMVRGTHGWHQLTTSAATVGARYRFLLPGGTRVPDPASRYQPEDVHGPSQVMDTQRFLWTDAAWRGRAWSEAILYELHTGTFTKEGTFSAATEKLDYLCELGITAIELMCLSDFAGNRSWGYDGVLPYAPDSAYGPPDELKRFIDQAHARGMMVILDVVYNHFGPEGNWIPLYFPNIFSHQHETPWGKSLNLDGPRSAEVREFILHNALYWIEEFHVDGLRLDASHAMVDYSANHILDELHDRVAALACGRNIHLILESEENAEGRLRRDSEGKPLGFAAQWNHDITHLLGAVFSDLCASDSAEETEKLAKAVTQGFVIAAEMKNGQTRCTVPPTAFVSFIQTHDLVGNRILGDRVSAHADARHVRAIASIYLLAPQIPMLFMGEEWGASTPFPFFCDYHGELANAVRLGRLDQLRKLDPALSEDELRRAPDPQAESTLRSAQLDWEEISQPANAAWLDWYKRIIRVRTAAVVPYLSGLTQCCGTSQIVGPGALVLSWTLKCGLRLYLAANLCNSARSGFPKLPGRKIWQEGSVFESEEFGPWTVRCTIEKP
jgi:malto-oligosyltrehalose trehalohydrolase